ncbi:hypothetical protein LCGC14_2917360 [marine sediment metagenome]|uniref:Uncharacterized protein n=1 Tax=marine sediment metagenome TaxID=412755 RepID=A0A0F9AFT4_9ZZZZ
MSKKDGGPAFPSSTPDVFNPSGMSLRDYYAAKAMAALLQTSPADDTYKDVATRAHLQADAMLKAREEAL